MRLVIEHAIAFLASKTAIKRGFVCSLPING